MLRDLIVSAKALAASGVILGALTAAVILSATDALASKRVRQPTRDDLATVWVGGGGGESIEFFRLELDAQGAGLLTVQYIPDSPASAYKVRGTSIAGYAIALEVSPIDARAQVLDVRGEATPMLLRLQVRGRAPDWTRSVQLQRYDELLKRIKAVTEKAEAHKNATR
jgi:hypothetical protein